LGSSSPPAFVSVVVTVKNEGRHIARLLDSLLVQEPPFEVVVVDALSRDGTWETLTRYASEHHETVRVVQKFGSRGIGRNTGVQAAHGELVAFIDGDCFADSRWLHEFRGAFAKSDVVAGETVALGPPRYAQLGRVELFQKGSDVTFPSCNLGYRRSVFLALHGFDPRFITAEDIDLNLRAVESGATIGSVPSARVYHQMRPTILRFLLQAFWNGYGRKQLTEKHGSLWGNYRLRRLISDQKSAIAWVRISAALFGYGSRMLTGVGARLSEGSSSGRSRENGVSAES
jgi:glycosyltransferase involved in cell wall biosynthesis